MVKPFSKSKRTPVRLRHKIEKRSAAKQRKDRKLAKKNPEWRSKLKKDPGIPNLFPFKDKILAEIEEKKRIKAEEAAKRKETAKTTKNSSVEEDGVDMGEEDLIDEDDEDLDDMDEDDSNPMAALLASAQARAAEYEGQSDEDEESYDEMDEDKDDTTTGSVSLPTTSVATSSLLHTESSRHAFDKIFKQVLEASDVILYVLDARDPLGTRSQEVERQVMAAASGSKRLILILNKIDLVPPPVLKGWLIHLRRYFPTLPLRASSPASNAQTFNHKSLTPQSTSSTLLKALKSYAHSSQLSRSISVGIIGYPNVGKSSVINALTSHFTKRTSQATTPAPVGSEAGVTTALRTIKLDSKLTLLDSPGIVFPSITSTGTRESRSDFLSRLTLLSALPPKQITDPMPAVTLLLKRLSTNPILLSSLLAHYNLPEGSLVPTREGDITTDFLIQVARKRGRLGKGGVPNLHAAAMQVVVDWRDGRIKGWVEPPVLEVDTGKSAGSATSQEQDTATAAAPKDNIQIVKEWSKEFKLDGLWGDGQCFADDEIMEG
ncbi:putative gtp-binding protein [Phaeomoniella chlamydospora]|uniref:Putative gtp-binding protein n=1 Tax=Phaeomoniella chlamydospora TaxID=158046 RepID=A0A0G2EBY7_PHACM|nr:putative gtp-binding protein [Phaeomoniella chlamydospora]